MAETVGTHGTEERDPYVWIGLNRAGGRALALILLLVVGYVDYVTGPDLAFAPFYLAVLLALGLFEGWPVCLLYSLLAGVLFLWADILWDFPARARTFYPYWRACARFIGFSVSSILISRLVAKREELRRAQEALVVEERRRATVEAVARAAYEMERPLNSLGLYVEELARPGRVVEDARPTLEKLQERVADLEVILQQIRQVRPVGEASRSDDGGAEPPGEGQKPS